MPENEHTEKSECEEQEVCQQHSNIEATDASSGTVEGADREQTRDPGDINRVPRITGVARRQPGREVAGKNQHAPHDDQEAGDLIDRRLADVTGDLLDVIQRRGGFPAFDAHDPLPAVATSSAIADTAAGSLTIPM